MGLIFLLDNSKFFSMSYMIVPPSSLVFFNLAVATGLEKVSFHSNPKERQLTKNVQTLV